MLYKKEFAERLAAKGYTLKDARTIEDDFIDVLRDIMVSGESVQFKGFGTFTSTVRQPRRALNIATREVYTMPSFRLPKFTAGKELKQAVRSEGTAGTATETEED